MVSAQRNRDIAIDIVRTVAIIIMIGANLGSLLPTPHDWWFRGYSSLAAPIFVALAGMMVAFSFAKPNNEANLYYFIKRGAFLILCGALVDMVIYGGAPFISMDVLYLIGLGLPLSYLAAAQSIRMNICIAILILLATVVLQYLIGYEPQPLHIKLSQISEISTATLPRIWRMWLIDGWFPVFPWLGYLIFGVILGQLRFASGGEESFISAKFILGSGLFLVMGSILMTLFPNIHFERVGYAELFYPPTLGFIILSFGVVVLAIALADLTSHHGFWHKLMPLGQASLFVYLTHLALIELIEEVAATVNLLPFLLIYVAMTTGLLWCAMLLSKVKRRTKSMPLPLRWLLGA